jgi:beta-hydroxylase
MATATAGSMPGTTGTSRRLFLDDDLEAAFTDVGYVVLPLLAAAEVAEHRERYARLHPPGGEGFVPDYFLDDPELKRSVDAAVRAPMRQTLDGLLLEAEPFMTSFLMKWADEDSALGLHRDWSYVDEGRFRTAVVWVALDDASDELDNGPLRVVPRSHRVVPRWRGTYTEDPFGVHHDLLERRCLVEVPVHAGEAVVMDNRLLHSSRPNRSGRPRLALATAVRPREARLVHAFQHDDGTIQLLEVDDEFFFEHSPPSLKASGPPPYPTWARVPAPEPDVDLDELGHVLGVRFAPEPPSAPIRARRPRRSDDLRRLVVRSSLQVNARLLGLAAEARCPLLDTEGLPWVQALEGAHPAIRCEVDTMLAAGVRLPRMADLLGVDQGDEGRWRALVLVARGQELDLAEARLPETMRLVRQVPGIQSALLSCFPPGMHLPAHRGPNKGVLRYHLGIRVPGLPGACRLRVQDEVVPYAEGRSILFDDTYEHEAWNDAGEPRISLFLEVRRPLTPPLRLVNEGIQGLYGLHPEATGVAARAVELDVALNGRLPA